MIAWSVPQTDTGGLVEKTKVNGWNLVKELGKKAGVSSQYAFRALNLDYDKTKLNQFVIIS